MDSNCFSLARGWVNLWAVNHFLNKLKALAVAATKERKRDRDRDRWAVVGIKQIELGFSKIANDHTYSDEFGVKQIILMCLMSDKCGGF